MSDESEESRSYRGASGGGIIGLIVLALIGWWIYTNVLVDNKKPWWNGVAYQRVCEVHNPNSTGCSSLPVTVDDGRITTLSLPDGKSAIISTNDCDKSDIDGGLAGKGKRYCVIGEISGGREWQVSEN
jgi:hypothetical protein